MLHRAEEKRMAELKAAKAQQAKEAKARRAEALSKLTEEDRRILGIKNK
jgi:hypothetical protein